MPTFCQSRRRHATISNAHEFSIRRFVSSLLCSRVAAFAAAFLLLLLFMNGASAQTFGSLSGTVVDPSNAVVSGATVTVTNTETGAARVAKTSSSGFYTFPDLLAGTYSIRVDAAGFQAELTRSVKLDAASPVSVSYKLHVGNVNDTVEVQAIAPELDRTSAAIGDTFSAQQVDNLPINGHDFARFTLLAPGATLRSSIIADVSFDGLGLQSGYFFLDGVDATRLDAPYLANGFERGARLMSGSLETVAEFRVQASAYQAEYGRAASGVVTIISKSGTDHWHGEGFDFYRNESFDARNFFARTGTKPLFRFNDFGGNIGGPIFDKKTFIFANYEGNVQNLGVIDNQTTLSSTTRSSALAAHPELAPLIAEYPIGVDSTANPQLATIFLKSVNNVNENTGSARIDHNFSQKDSIFGRYNYNESVINGPLYAVSAAYYGNDARQLVPTGVTNVAVHEQHIFNPRWINDALFGFARYSASTYQSEPIPTTIITGVSGDIGAGESSVYHNQAFQYGDSMTLVLHNHTLKWGGTFWRRSENYSHTGVNLLYYSSVTNFINNVALQVIEEAALPGSYTRDSELGVYAQDNWQVTPKLTLNYGVRWDVETTPYDARHTDQAYNPQSGTLFSPGHEYYPVNLRDFGPRLGIAYSPSERTVVRAGGGLFYRDYLIGYLATDIPSNIVPGNVTLTQTANPGLKYPFAGYSNGTTPLPTVYGFPSSKPDLYSVQYNLSVQQELTRGLSAQIAYIGLHGINLDRQADVNLYNQGTAVRPNTNFGDIYLFEGNGFDTYNGLQAILKANIGHLTADVNYAWSHAIDNVCDIGYANTEPQNYNNIAAERANSCQDQRQNFKYSLLYEIPMGTGYAFLGHSAAPVRALASGWNIDSLGIMHSGIPVNITQGVNTYGNGDILDQRPNIFTDQPLYVPTAINPATGYKNFLNPSAWGGMEGKNNYPATGTFGNSPRNPVFGPHFTQVDASVVKNTPVHNGQLVEFRVQMYNIFNHPNFAQPNAVYAPGSLIFGEITSTLGSTLGFGSARQLELALKYKF